MCVCVFFFQDEFIGISFLPRQNSLYIHNYGISSLSVHKAVRESSFKPLVRRVCFFFLLFLIILARLRGDRCQPEEDLLLPEEVLRCGWNDDTSSKFRQKKKQNTKKTDEKFRRSFATGTYNIQFAPSSVRRMRVFPSKKKKKGQSADSSSTSLPSSFL